MRGRLRNAWLYALPGGRMPAAVVSGGVRYVHVATFKHDFFAATGLYRGPEGLVVLKVGRTQDILSCPGRWIGALLAWQERGLYERLAGVRGVPRLIGPAGATGMLREYIPGAPLARRDQVSDTFFFELEQILQEVHARHIAYVDLNKRQNIIKGADGRPYLIDFQISLYVPSGGWGRLAPLRWLLACCQRADYYHYLKHKRRLRPDLLAESEAAAVSRISPWIRLHRWIARPLTALRRRALRRLQRGEDLSVAGSSAK